MISALIAGTPPGRANAFFFPILLLVVLECGCSDSKPLEKAPNNPPVIESVAAIPETLVVGERADVVCAASDPDNDALSYEWTTPVGEFVDDETVSPERRKWQSPLDAKSGLVTITVAVSDFEDQVMASVELFLIGESSTLGGVVRDGLTLDPLAGATLSLGSRSTSSDSSGTYLFESVPTGSYEFLASLDGYDPFSEQLTLDEGENTNDITLFPLGQVGTISGTITNSRSEAVAGAVCQIRSLEVSSTTGATGGYEIRGVPHGTYTFEVTSTEYELSTGEVVVDSPELTVDRVLAPRVPPAPDNVRASKTGTDALVSWDAVQWGTVTGYEVWINGEFEADVSASRTTYSYRGDLHGRYEFQVAAVNYDDEVGTLSDPSSIIVLTPLSGRVSIPAGSVIVGDTPPAWSGGAWGTVPHPANPIAVAGFEIESTEVSNRQYRAFLYEVVSSGAAQLTESGVQGSGEMLLLFQPSRIHYENNDFTISEGFEEHPVVGVTWFGAEAYAEHFDLRLPTEVEWELAARGRAETYGVYESSSVGFGLPYPWGTAEPADTLANFENNHTGTIEVSSLPDGATIHWSSPIYHLSGNVAEWCADWFGSYRDPHQPPSTGTRKVLRGGAWADDREKLLSGARAAWEPAVATLGFGFRCVASR